MPDGDGSLGIAVIGAGPPAAAWAIEGAAMDGVDAVVGGVAPATGFAGVRLGLVVTEPGAPVGVGCVTEERGGSGAAESAVPAQAETAEHIRTLIAIRWTQW
jgi:hypothetical protein